MILSMAGGNVARTRGKRESADAPGMDKYDPFRRGEFPVGVRTLHTRDAARDRVFPCEIWYPAAESQAGKETRPETQDAYIQPPHNWQRRQLAVRDAQARSGSAPLIVFSHHSGGRRRSATYLATHLASHGYLVAALDHSETVASELMPRQDETEVQKKVRAEAWIANRVPDIRFLLDFLVSESALDSGLRPDPDRIGIAGHSLGGWTALAATEADRRIRAAVALAPSGSSKPRPGILRNPLQFRWGRDVPTLYLVAENDVPLPLDGMYELFEKTPATKLMVILCHADHLHFIDDVEIEHEAVRTMPWPPLLAWMPREMKPIAELCSGEIAHLFTRGLSLAHLDAQLRGFAGAQSFLDGDVAGALADRGIDAIVRRC